MTVLLAQPRLGTSHKKPLCDSEAWFCASKLESNMFIKRRKKPTLSVGALYVAVLCCLRVCGAVL